MPKVVSSVKALLLHQGKYLVLRERLSTGKEIWDLPGGKIEYGESPEETLAREIKEELDLEIEIKKSVGVWYFFHSIKKFQVICLTFLCTPTTEKIKIDTTKNPADENFTELLWLTLEEIIESKTIDLPPSLNNLLKKLIQEIN